jgi:corrinoid protein of di/trimethylamine methyltransferase
MEKQEILQGLYDAILSLEPAKAKEVAEKLVNSDIDPIEALEKKMSPAMEEIGRRFKAGELFLPELQISAEVFRVVMDVLQPKILASGRGIKSKGRIVIGTVKGDVHSIGKDLVATMLRTAGFEVFDVGVDIPAFTFLEEAQNKKADIIALSALLTTTMPMQQEVIEALKSEGLREKFRVIIGGGPVTQEWAQKIGADGYGENAAQAVDLAKNIIRA